jgi:hypothetical protein
MWVKKWLLERDRFTHLNVLNFIRDDSPDDYKNYFIMSDENVKYLLEKVSPFILKQDTVMLMKVLLAMEADMARLQVAE